MKEIEIVQKQIIIAERKKTVITVSVSDGELPRVDLRVLNKNTNIPINCVWLIGAEIENLRQVLNEWKGETE